MATVTNRTFAECAKDPRGTIYHDEMLEEGTVRFLIMRGGASLNAYLGIPEGHALAGKDYETFDLDVHGGPTFAGTGDEKDGLWRPRDWYWYGWDYAHAGDLCFYALYDLHYPMRSFLLIHEHGWTVEDVLSDSQDAIAAFVMLIKEAERG